VRGQEHAALVIDQLFMEADGEAADVVLENTGDAVPVFVSFAISRAERTRRRLPRLLRWPRSIPEFQLCCSFPPNETACFRICTNVHPDCQPYGNRILNQ
jgi:hypothetical protein